MSVYDERREELEKQEFMMGAERGRLAVTLDLLTDALILVGQHGVYCQSARQPGKPAMDIQMISKCLTDAKELVAETAGNIVGLGVADGKLLWQVPFALPPRGRGGRAYNAATPLVDGRERKQQGGYYS